MAECSVTVKRGDQCVRVSPHQNEEEQWELNLCAKGFLPGGFPFEVTLPPFGYLHVLKVTTRGIRTIPDDIKNLENVTRLWLVGGDLEGFPLAVCLLKRLIYLRLSGNEKIQKIPPGTCGKMNSLIGLYMSECGLTCLPEDFDQMVNLEELDLSFNSMSHLSDGLKNMRKLRYVWLSANPFECLENEFPFDSLVNVEHLDLYDTNIKTLPGEIGRMVKIKYISLTGNKLTCLPKEFCNLPSDAEVALYANPISSPPFDVCKSGMPSIKSYFQSLEGDNAVKRTRRTKMIILGESESGKSSLIRAIIQFLKGLLQDACTKEGDITIGIDQHRVSLNNVDLVVLDTGGQRSYSPISQLFTSSSCLVIITADATQYTARSRLAFRRLVRPYLQRIHDYVGVAVILPVITKADLVTDDQLQTVATDLGHKLFEFEKEREVMLDKHRDQNSRMSTERQDITVIAKKERKLKFFTSQEKHVKKHQDKCLSKIMPTSAKTAIGIYNLISYVKELLQDRSLFPGLDTVLPSSWVQAEDQLLSAAKIHSPPICSLATTLDVIIPCGLFRENAQGLLSYLHSVGSICHYDQYPSLRRHVFLQPQFLIDLLKAVYHHELRSILTVDTVPPSQRTLVTQLELELMLTDLIDNGIACVKLLRLIWSRFGFKEEHYNLMIKLLLSFNFAYVRCDNQDVITTVDALIKGNMDHTCDDLLSLLTEHSGELLLPWFFRDMKPDGLPTVCASDDRVSVCLTYSFAMSLPEGLFQRLSARCHRHSNSTQHWLNGVHMNYAAITAVLQCDEERAEIVLSASTVASLNAYFRLWHVVWRLIVDIENEIKQTPGTIHLVQRYMSASQKYVQSVLEVGARQIKVQLHEEYPAFQMNEVDPIAQQLQSHKTAVTSAQKFAQIPLRRVLSPDTGKDVTEQDVEDIALLIDNEKALSKLRVTLKVKETDVMESTGVCDKALAVLNTWRQSSSHACVAILRDALQKAGLESVNERVFGHIRDLTLTKQEPETTNVDLSLPGILETSDNRSITHGGVGDTILSGTRMEQLAGISPCLATEADSKVISTQLVVVAKKIAGFWDELAAWLSPELFSPVKLKEIKEDHSSSFSRARAVLEVWCNDFGSKANCRLLIQSLCRMDQRAMAAGVFGTELVQFIEPL